MLLATRIGVVLLHQGPVSRLQLRCTRRAGHAQHLIGIASRRRLGQGQAKATAILVLEAGRPSLTTKKPPADAGGRGFWCVSVREVRVRSGLIRRSELEAHLNHTTKGIEGFALGGVLTSRTAQIEQSWSHADVVGDLEVVPPFPGIIAILGGLTVEGGGSEGLLTHGHTGGVALNEHVVPLQAHHPGLSVLGVDHILISTGET